MKKIFITGSDGFIGKSLVSIITQNTSLDVFQSKRVGTNANECTLDFASDFNIESELSEIDVLIHCAARVHVMNDKSFDPYEAFHTVNTLGTLCLAQQAANAGVKRFIFISSIKVNGESTEPNFPFKPDEDFIPTDPYGLSKYEAEVGLRNIAEQTGMEVVIIRPPLVYGPGVKANFASMIKWMNRGLPLPLGGIRDNKRSLVSIYNLVDLIITCIDHPSAANNTFLVSDDDDLSTTQLLVNIASACNVPNRLLPVPSSIIVLIAKLIRKPEISQRLCASLQVDISKTKELLNWSPKYPDKESFEKTIQCFIRNKK